AGAAGGRAAPAPLPGQGPWRVSRGAGSLQRAGSRGDPDSHCHRAVSGASGGVGRRPCASPGPRQGCDGRLPGRQPAVTATRRHPRRDDHDDAHDRGFALGGVIPNAPTDRVFALGAVTLLASAVITPERLYPYLTLASGLMVAALGISLVVSRTRLTLGAGPLLPTRTGPGAELAWQGHSHEHEHAGSHSHGLGEHTHQPPRPGTGMGPLVAMGVAGGLLPCPSALIVMLSAIALHRVAFGLVLIIAFSLGLALMLTGIGVALAAGAPLLARLPGRDRLPSGL